MSQVSDALQFPEGVRPLERRSNAKAVASDAPPAGLVAPLLSISKLTRALLGVLLADVDLNAGQDQLLAALDDKRSISVSAVSNAINVRPSTTSKMVDRLVAKGLVERCGGDENKDARLTLLRLTPAGVVRRTAVQDLWARLERGLADKLEVVDQEEMVAALSSVDDVLRRRLLRLR